MAEIIRVVSIILVMTVFMVQNASNSVYARASEYLKEDIEVAAHDAALQLNHTKLADGNFIIDKIKAKNVFRESLELNTGMNTDDYTIVDFIVFDESNSTFPLRYKHPVLNVEDIFFGPTVLAIVETTTGSYFNGGEKPIRKLGSYSYDLKGNELESVTTFSNSTIQSYNQIEEYIISQNGMYWPVPFTKNATSPFGMRTHPITKENILHSGMDIAAAGIENKPAVSALEGNVIYAGMMKGYGNVVIINHSNGFQTRYGHLNTITVETGQTVRAGDVVGLIGSTGRSTGPHLHFETRINNKPINPANFF